MKWIYWSFGGYMTVLIALALLSIALEQEQTPDWVIQHVPPSLTLDRLYSWLGYLTAGIVVFPLALMVNISSSVYDWDDMIRLRKFGKLVKVRILDYDDAGIRVNEVPVLKLTLEVHDSESQPYTVHTKQLVSLTDLHNIESDVWYNGYAHKTKRREVVVIL